MAERYLLFAGDRYYPSGGWRDYKMDFSSVESAKTAVTGLDDYDWWQIVDSETRQIVESVDTSEQW